MNDITDDTQLTPDNIMRMYEGIPSPTEQHNAALAARRDRAAHGSTGQTLALILIATFAVTALALAYHFGGQL